jgi:hypothetical protein
MVCPSTHEVARLLAENAAHEHELDQRANVISELADTLAATRAELADAVALGTQYVTLLRAVAPQATIWALGATETALSPAFTAEEGHPTSEGAEGLSGPDLSWHRRGPRWEGSA